MTLSFHIAGIVRTGAVALILFTILTAGADGRIRQEVDPAEVDKAIEKGARWLLERNKHGGAEMLVLLTLIHAKEPQEQYGDLIENALEKPLKRTYQVSLTAMALHELWREEKDEEKRHRYFRKLLHCAQFLVDNQAPHGQWRYGEPVPLEKVEPKSNDVATPGGKDGKKDRRRKDVGKTKAEEVVRKRFFGFDGDNSNTQYASLGLRACMDSGIRIPSEVLDLAIEYLEGSQGKQGGWSYGSGGSKTTVNARGSMTAGSISALAIFKYLAKLNKPGRKFRFIKDKAIANGVSWLDKNFTVRTNPKAKDDKWHFYYLYALERVGMLLDTERVGRHAWYPIGARYLLKKQYDDGHWLSEKRDAKEQSEAHQVRDTCFAILFLRKSTRPLTTKGGKR